jgi:hypothetical protein
MPAPGDSESDSGLDASGKGSKESMLFCERERERGVNGEEGQWE